jgi:hypothetical protein
MPLVISCSCCEKVEMDGKSGTKRKVTSVVIGYDKDRSLRQLWLHGRLSFSTPNAAHHSKRGI